MALGQGMPDGAMDAVSAALQRRSQGGNAPMLNQQTSVAPASPQIPTPQMPQGTSAMPSGGGTGGSMPGSENELIIKALSKYLNRLQG